MGCYRLGALRKFMPKIIDTHCHLDDERFGHQLEQVIDQAKAIGVEHFVIPATTQKRWDLLRLIKANYSNIHLAFGFHPCFMQEHQKQHLQDLESIIESTETVAVGECGLDFFDSNQNEKTQIELFNAQLDIARNAHLPCIIHSRKSLDKVLSLLRKKAIKGGIIHSFSGSLQQAQQIADLGLKIGVAATVCFERAKKLQKVIAQLPIQSMVVESDAPDQVGPDNKGKVNQPKYIPLQIKKIAELKEMDESEVSAKLFKNSVEVFNIN